MIEESMAAVGAARSIVIDDDLVVRAGEGALKAARKLGLKLRVVEADGQTLIAVRRRGLTNEQKTALALYDNRTAELAEWDPAVLKALADQGFDFRSMFSEEDLQAILDAGAIERAGLTPADQVPPTRTTTIQPGDLFQLGAHRLLCGDSTDRGHVERVLDGTRPSLVATDPPYLVDYTGERTIMRNGKPKAEGKDWSQLYREVDIQDAEQFFRAVFTNIVAVMGPHAPVYCWHAHRRVALIQRIWEELGLLDHQQLIWVKPTAVFGRAYWKFRHEPCVMGWRKGSKPPHDGDNTIDSVWEIDWEGKKRVVGNEHPTQKPVEVFARPMRKHTRKGAVCFEPFSGSGSQIVAGEMLGRRVYAIDVEPQFIQVAIDRWEAFTGQKAQHLGHARTGPKAAATKQHPRARSTK